MVKIETGPIADVTSPELEDFFYAALPPMTALYDSCFKGDILAFLGTWNVTSPEIVVRFLL